MWYALDVTFEAAAREAVEYALMEAGALGTETTGDELTGGVRPLVLQVSAYFDAPPDQNRIRRELLGALRIYGHPAHAVRDILSRPVAAQDWLAEWKKSWQPIEVGRRFIVAPPWSEINGAGPGRIVLRIEPGMAFGTGTHETTRLCLAAIEKHFDGTSFLDVGTGTGILSIAAAKLSPVARIEACDVDDDCITIAHQNARLNQVAERIDFRVGTIEEETASATLVCANLTADAIVPLLPALVAASCGRLILSGILVTQIDLVLSRLQELGIEEYEVEIDGEWVALTV